MNYFNYPLLNPFKLVPDTDKPGIHLDQRWAALQIRAQEMNVRYLQKWQLADKTKLQVESSVALPALQLIDVNKQVIKTFAWVLAAAGTGYSYYETLFDISDCPENTYFIAQQVTFAGVVYSLISEPIAAKISWPNTLLFNYRNSYNDWGVAFSTGIAFSFRVEADIPPAEYQFLRDRATGISQYRNVLTLSGVPYRQAKLYIGGIYGGDKGVAPWVIDLMNRIFICDYIEVGGMPIQSQSDAKWEQWRAKGMPLIAAAIDIVPATNRNSLQLNDLVNPDGSPYTDGPDPLQGIAGVVVVYNIDTGFFGPSNIVPINEIEKH